MENTKQSQPNLRVKLGYWKQSAANLIRMGHCAPTVMKTIQDVSDSEKEWLIKLSAGMPGGIGNTGFECGALTSPLALMGLQYGLRETDGGLPVVFEKGHTLCQHFLQCHKTLQCKLIRKDDHFPKRCIRPVCLAPQLYVASTTNNSQTTIPPETRDAYRRIYSHWVDEKFHCAQAVFDKLQYTPAEHQELVDAVSAFMGGTLFMGMTCSAFVAGVMAIGLRIGEIEDSPLRVIRLLSRMTFGGDAFDEKINKFTRPMNAGYRMSKWFRQEFGSTQCQAITGCDFSTQAGVNKYIGGRSITQCKAIAAKVAEKVELLLTRELSVQS